MTLDISKQLNFINNSLKNTFYPEGNVVTAKEEKIDDEHSNNCNGCALCESDDEMEIELDIKDEYQEYKDSEINELNANRN